LPACSPLPPPLRIEQLYACRDPALIYAGVELKSLRNQPRFQQLLRKIGLNPQKA